MEPDPRSRRRFLAAVGTAAAAGIAGCSATSGEQGTTADDDPTTTGTGDAGGASDDGPNPYTQVYRQTIDSVVLIRVFGQYGNTSQGSGFVSPDGHLVTNEHVVAGAEAIEVGFSNGEWRDGEVLGTDAYSDLAALTVDDRPDSATPLELVDEDPPIGAEVVALGNPFGFGESVAAGIVSGVDRSLPGTNNFVIPDAIQTDAAVNPGNSGGPLVTLDGGVVGAINSGGGDNIGFAISAALIRRVIPSLAEAGRYDHPYMGVQLLTVTPTVADANGLDEASGALVTNVLADRPSDGVLQGSDDTATVHNSQVPVGGDVIRRLGDREIGTLEDLSVFLALETRPGDTIPVEVLRDGRAETVDLTLGTRPAPSLAPDPDGDWPY